MGLAVDSIVDKYEETKGSETKAESVKTIYLKSLIHFLQSASSIFQNLQNGSKYSWDGMTVSTVSSV